MEDAAALIDHQMCGCVCVSVWEREGESEREEEREKSLKPHKEKNGSSYV